MATGWTAAAANNALDSLGTTYPWIQMHVGPPGADGTANVAVNSTRQQVTWGSASAGVKTNTAGVSWSNVAGSETYTHCSLWNQAVAGTAGETGTVTAAPVNAGDNFTINAGQITLQLPLAA